MANVLAPFGFAETQRLGAAPNYQMTRCWISPSNATAIYFGDPVTQINTGYVAQSVAGSTQIKGIFAGCEYYSLSQKKPFWSRYWPGNTADVSQVGNNVVAAYVIDDPQAEFFAQGNGQITFAMIGETIQFALGTGSTTTGFSGATLDVSNVGSTTTYPFKIIDLVIAPPGANGADTTTSYNWARVTFNYQDYKSLTGI